LETFLHSYRFSPLPIEEYRITSLEQCEVGSIMARSPEHRLAMWNLWWLSLPSVDALPVWGKSPLWFNHYRPTPGAMRAIAVDALGDDQTFEALLMPPARFIQFFREDDKSIYDCYTALNGMDWVATVLNRAAAAAQRIEIEEAPRRRDNVYSFPRKKVA
jgi:hypothetical protein